MWVVAEERARLAAIAAARAAASSVTPGQRDKAIAEAAAAVTPCTLACHVGQTQHLLYACHPHDAQVAWVKSGMNEHVRACAQAYAARLGSDAAPAAENGAAAPDLAIQQASSSSNAEPAVPREAGTYEPPKWSGVPSGYAAFPSA